MAQNGPGRIRLERGFWIATAILTLLSIAASWFLIVTPFDRYLPEGAIPADQIDWLTKFLSVTSTIIYIYVVGYLLYFAVAFRHRKSEPLDAVGVQIHDNRALETWWTAVPTVLVIVLAFFSVKIWAGLQQQPNNGLVLLAVGHQWYFDFEYPGVKGTVTDEMHLPLGTPVTLHTTSQDVIHSFWVPAIRLKADMVPGLINTLRFTPTRAGSYQIICTEYCGVNHGAMWKERVVIEPMAKFQSWLAKTKVKNAKLAAHPASGVNLAKADAQAGQQLFGQKCSACHALGPFSQRIVGPGLKGIFNDPAHPKLVNGDPAKPDSVAKIIRNGYQGDMGTMPNAQSNGLSENDVANVTAFLAKQK